MEQTTTTISEGVLYVLKGREAIAANVNRLTPGQAILVYDPRRHEEGVPIDVSFTRTVLQTVQTGQWESASKKTERFVCPAYVEVAGKSGVPNKMVRVGDIDPDDVLSAPSINITTRIGAKSPSWWAGARETRTRKDPATWSPVKGADVRGMIQRGLACSTEKTIPYLGLLTKTNVDDRSVKVWIPGGGEGVFTPMVPATAGIPRVWSASCAQVFESTLNRLMMSGLPIGIGWRGKGGHCYLSSRTARRNVGRLESVQVLETQIRNATARRFATEMDLPEMETFVAHGENQCSLGFVTWLGTNDGRAAIDMFNESVQEEMAKAILSWESPSWLFNAPVGLDYKPLIDIELSEAANHEIKNRELMFA